jgi:hypothetical protein
LKKLEPDATALLRLIERWRIEAVRAGRPISRIALAYEAGRDGFRSRPDPPLKTTGRVIENASDPNSDPG